ncbi:YggT family protein [Polycladidibacter stylochi]|uniref:YggT family protein n=1 Tax=Polycladidibacter stylochi TaxID=1807766 RepID=UPI0008306111|nr:YggT family protein [Pseudovibrio stylochi]
MRSVLDIIMIILNLYYWVVIANVIFSWLYAFNVINSRNQFVASIGQALYALTEPFLKPIRRVVPSIGGLDLSPLILLLGVIFIQSVISRYLYQIVW